ncbi:MAG: S8 family serine peptidase, partial [Miltoncostaeaceae bacterium]
MALVSRATSVSGAVTAALALILAGQAAAAPLISQGAYRIGADALWSQGLLGQGQTIAVLDEGYMGLDRSIELGELPPRSEMDFYNADPLNGWDGVSKLGTPTPHGVRMAEIVHDIAPRARLVLVRYRTPSQFAAAAAWIADRGIPVVSHSSSRLTAPFDGTGVYARAVDAAAARGVLWVNSAGNYARRHWTGTAAGLGAGVPLLTRDGDRLLISASWEGPARFALTAQAFDPAAGGWRDIVAGEPDGPQTLLIPTTLVGAGAHRVLVRQTAGSPTRVDITSQTAGFGGAAVGEGSVTTPGDARGALTVGAVNWSTDVVAPYSSYGPTRDGRAKPDIAGPTYITSNPEWPGTAGTSASTPHVAAGAVLLRQHRLSRGLPAGAADLRAALLGSARPVEDPVPGRTGAGMVRLDTVPPRLGVSVTRARRPVVRVRALDAGTIERVTISVDGPPGRAGGRPAGGGGRAGQRTPGRGGVGVR